MPTLTPNFSFNLPLVNNATDADLWGGLLNANWTSIDTLLVIPPPIPIGSPIPYLGAAAPTSYLLCYGETIGDVGSGADLESADYEALFDIAKEAAPNAGTESFAGGDSVTIIDLRGRVVAGQDDMGGTSANRLTGASGGVDGDGLGNNGGSETHALTSAQNAAHSHTVPNNGLSAQSGNGQYGGNLTGVNVLGISTGSSGSGSAHNNVQPTAILNYIVRYE